MSVTCEGDRNNSMVVERTVSQHFQEGWRLLRLAYPPRRKTLTEFERADKASVSRLEQHILEQVHYGLWFDQTMRLYLRAELRRRALVEMAAGVKTCVRRMKRWCWFSLTGE